MLLETVCRDTSRGAFDFKKRVANDIAFATLLYLIRPSSNTASRAKKAKAFIFDEVFLDYAGTLIGHEDHDKLYRP